MKLLFDAEPFRLWGEERSENIARGALAIMAHASISDKTRENSMKSPLRIKVIRALICTSLLCILTGYARQGLPQSQDIESISIRSSWTGLAPVSESRLSIRQKNGIFFANGRKVDTKLIDEVLVQIDNKNTQTMESLGITREWLVKNANSAIPSRLKKALPIEKEYFRSSFCNIDLIKKILPRMFHSWTDSKGGFHLKFSTDDYPEFEMRIIKRDGSEMVVSSMSQNLYMFDNPNLGKAISALLPNKFTNRERLNGDSLVEEIGEEVYKEIEDELNRIGSLARISNEWNQLKDKYSIRKTMIGHISSIDTGTPTSAYQKNDTDRWNYPSWNAELVRGDLPQNIILGVSLPFRHNKLDTFPSFIQKIDGIIEQVLSVPWFSKCIKDNPTTEFEIRFVQDRSFSIQAKENFLEKLKEFGDSSLEAGIINALDHSVFIQVQEKSGPWSRWLILPDKRMILWQINGSTVLKWKPENFKTLNLYDKKDWFHAKALISPDGTIESR
jgi:hypothetical protein